MRRIPIIALLAICAAPALAQSPASPPTAVQAGHEVRLGYYSIFRRDCSAGPAPQVHITSLPRHGTVTLRTGVLATKRVPNCPVSRAPATMVFYRAAQDFAGPDAVGFDVVDPASGATQPHAVTVVVTPYGQPI